MKEWTSRRKTWCPFYCQKWTTVCNSDFCKMMKYAILKKTDEMYIIKSVKHNRILKALKLNAFVIAFKDLTKCAVWHNIDLE